MRRVKHQGKRFLSLGAWFGVSPQQQDWKSRDLAPEALTAAVPREGSPAPQQGAQLGKANELSINP